MQNDRLYIPETITPLGVTAVIASVRARWGSSMQVAAFPGWAYGDLTKLVAILGRVVARLLGAERAKRLAEAERDRALVQAADAERRYAQATILLASATQIPSRCPFCLSPRDHAHLSECSAVAIGVPRDPAGAFERP